MADQKRAAIYARSAVVQEIGSNNAITEQIHQCKVFGEKQGYSFLDEYIFQEIGSGSSIDRPILKSLLETAKEGKFDAVIIHTFDRLSRLPEQASVIIATLEGYGIRVLSVTEPVLPCEIDALIGRMVATLDEEANKLTREKISLRFSVGKERQGL